MSTEAALALRYDLKLSFNVASNIASREEVAFALIFNYICFLTLTVISISFGLNNARACAEKDYCKIA